MCGPCRYVVLNWIQKKTWNLQIYANFCWLLLKICISPKFRGFYAVFVDIFWVFTNLMMHGFLNMRFFQNQKPGKTRSCCTLIIFIPGCSGAETKCTLHVALPERPINLLKLVPQIRQQALRANCSNIYINWAWHSFNPCWTDHNWTSSCNT